MYRLTADFRLVRLEGNAKFHEISVFPPIGSMVTEVTYTNAAGPEVEGMPWGAEMNNSASPILMLLDVPAIQVDVSLPINVQGFDVAAGIALLAMVAARGDDVSNTCGDCPGPGT